jgi:hypothetical protein
MGLLGKIKGMFKKGTELSRENISPVGLKVLADEKLAQRIDALQGFYDYFDVFTSDVNVKAQLDEVEKKSKELNAIIKIVATPYGRSGSEHAWSMISSGWNGLHMISLDVIQGVRNLIEDSKDELNQLELVRKLKGYCLVDYWQYGMLVLDVSFKAEDVSPSTATVIQSIVQGGEFGQGRGIVLVGAEEGMKIAQVSPDQAKKIKMMKGSEG